MPMIPPSLITLLTDFGPDSHYVAQMKGVLLGLNPGLRIVDLSHAVAPQQIRQAAFLLQQSVAAFPADTCHVVVVDPGVGTDRRILLARIQGQYFVSPDNGVLSDVMQDGSVEWVRSITASQYWRPSLAATFHGRDIMAPVAAHLSLGVPPAAFGPRVDDPHVLTEPTVVVRSGQLCGTVVHVDAFGNLITDLRQSLLESISSESVLQVYVDRAAQPVSVRRVRTYADQPAGSLVVLIGSGGYVEIAQVNGNAAATLGGRTGTPVRLIG
jgi:S-adenosylmethionine hydrolase